ncbi:anti-sigma factor [Halobacillus sp. Marseille-Q1614]|uniref:anti-sigma factor family protein n=1 Tax=Halobacillus sp. Marseille-Q1614 TaxID=2709134 RepID=UPI00156E25FC|nr:anti-sigma factor [Halobacillus sp. Marseille-Q1614]
MNCKKEAVVLMHKYLDGELNKEEERRLRDHLQACPSCQSHFHELKRSITLIKSTDSLPAPENFTAQVMNNLPKQKKRKSYVRTLQRHPFITAAAVFFLLMFSGILSVWEQDQQMTVSKQENLIIQDDTVIVPEGVTVQGDLVVRNGDLKVEGKIDGDVTLINGDFITDEPEGPLANGENYQAYASGEINEVNQVFEWMWYHTKNFITDVFSFGSDSE